MSMQSSIFVFLSDGKVLYLVGNRLLNFRVTPHGDHHNVDMSIHLVRQDTSCAVDVEHSLIVCRDFGACRFRLPVSNDEYAPGCLVGLIESDIFQAFVRGPLDYLAGDVDPNQFGMLSD